MNNYFIATSTTKVLKEEGSTTYYEEYSKLNDINASNEYEAIGIFIDFCHTKRKEQIQFKRLEIPEFYKTECGDDCSLTMKVTLSNYQLDIGILKAEFNLEPLDSYLEKVVQYYLFMEESD